MPTRVHPLAYWKRSTTYSSNRLEGSERVTTPIRATIAALLLAVAGLGVALGIVLATDEDGDDGGRMMGQGQGIPGMMSAMADMDSDAMLAHMKEVLGDDGYQRMRQHFQDHRSGGPMTNMTNIDEMMHAMMDGMMAEMPADANNVMPRSGHADMPTVTGTPTQTR